MYDSCSSTADGVLYAGCPLTARNIGIYDKWRNLAQRYIHCDVIFGLYYCQKRVVGSGWAGSRA